MGKEGDGPATDAAAEIHRAVDLATALLRERGEDLSTFRITAAVNRLRDADGGASAWRVTFKPRRLIGNGSEIGAGGEWFVDVDLERGSARLGGVGE
jgi:hypothetical protein